MHPVPPSLRSFDSAAAISAAIAEQIRAEITGNNPAHRLILLSGGKTPLEAYAILAQSPGVISPGVVLAFSDERLVPRNSSDNNYHQAKPFLDAWSLTEEQAIPVQTDLAPEHALGIFQHKLARMKADAFRFPLAILGMGADGHTAGLFRHEHLEKGADRCAIRVDRPDGLSGITVTPPVLSWFDRVIFLITGAAKRPRLNEWLSGRADVIAALATQACRHVEIWLDPEATPEA